MADAKEVLDGTFMEMRWRVLSLAADFDRVQRAEGGEGVLGGDARVGKLREAIKVLLDGEGERAERVQMVFSDRTPPPAR